MGVITTKKQSKSLQKNPYQTTKGNNIRGFDANSANIQISTNGSILRVFAYPYGFMRMTQQQSSPFNLSRGTFSSLTKSRVNTAGYEALRMFRKDPKRIVNITKFKLDKRVITNTNYFCGTALGDFNAMQKIGARLVGYFYLRGTFYEEVSMNRFNLIEDNSLIKTNKSIGNTFQSEVNLNNQKNSSEPSSFNNKIQSLSVTQSTNTNYASPAYTQFDFELHPYFSRSIDFSTYLLIQNCKYEGNQLGFKNTFY